MIGQGFYTPPPGARRALDWGKRGDVTQGSSLPPLKKNDGKFGIIALVLLLVAGVLWFFLRDCKSGTEAEPAQRDPEVEVEPRAQFAPEIEIPDDDAGLGAGEEGKPESKPRESAQTRPADWICNGTIPATQLSQVIRGQPSKQVQTCYERRLKDDNLLQGSMKVLLTIGASGSVRAVSVSGSLNDSQVYNCVK
ncbi:MAG: AgmX/PglI C-terminal domain-containing protein, partial [Myxococcales bacterium]|nr:AgmX/PglI C-terminal domain-containing protein [Myxococcales bacterium]